MDYVNVMVEGQGGRRRAAALVDRRREADRLERDRRRRGSASLPGGADGGANPTQPWGCDVSVIVSVSHHRDAEENRDDPSDNVADFPIGRNFFAPCLPHEE